MYLIAGIALGVIVVGLLLLQSPQSGQALRNAVAKLQAHHTAKSENAKPKKTPEAKTTPPVSTAPKFDFYTMLPQMQVDVGGTVSTPTATVEATKTPVPAAVPPAAPVLTGGNQYTLQVASFRNFADADKVKANLTLQGFNVHVKPMSVNGVTWNRVYIGPFSSLATAKNTQQDLASQKINSIIVASGAN